MLEVRFLDILPHSRRGRSTLYNELTQEFPNHPSARDVSDPFDGAVAGSSIPSLRTLVAV